MLAATFDRHKSMEEKSSIANKLLAANIPTAKTIITALTHQKSEVFHVTKSHASSFSPSDDFKLYDSPVNRKSCQNVLKWLKKKIYHEPFSPWEEEVGDPSTAAVPMGKQGSRIKRNTRLSADPHWFDPSSQKAEVFTQTNH